MNEFEWRRQMRELRQPQTPQRDLWASIETALEDAQSARTPLLAATPMRKMKSPRRWLIGAGLAASLLMAAGIAWHLRQTPASTQVASTAAPLTKWKPSDPRLAGAAIELDAARMELQQAIQQSPNSPGLQRILVRTQQQQAQLRQRTGEAS